MLEVYAGSLEGIANMDAAHRVFVSYIDRTREFYLAQGYEKPYRWACFDDAPFCPLPKPLAECRLTLVTTASPWRDQVARDGVLRGIFRIRFPTPLPSRIGRSPGVCPSTTASIRLLSESHWRSRRGCTRTS